MYNPVDISNVKDLIQKSQEILILTHDKPSADSVGSVLALYLGLINLGKKVTIACPDQITVGLSDFIGVNKIVSEMHKKNFVISLDYIEGSIEKVSYNIEGEKFNLVVEPRPGFESFDSDKVHFYHTGLGADLIFTIDTIQLAGLKKLYDENPEMFSTKPVINIDRHANNSNYGQLNIVNPSSATTAEIIAQVLSGIDVQITEDIATNLINAITIGSNNFQSPFVKAETFELIANCFRAGGKRFGAKITSEEIPSEESIGEAHQHSVLQTEPLQSKSSTTPPQIPSTKSYVKPKETPEDWLKPKIFKSTSTL